MEVADQRGILFRMDKIPDLTLTRYSSLGGRGIDEILEKHVGFLRQFSRKADSSVHLLYAYNPKSTDGSRLHIYLLICDTTQPIILENPEKEDNRKKANPLDNVRELVESSPLAPFFGDLKMIYRKDGSYVSAERGKEDTYAMTMSEALDFIASEGEAGTQGSMFNTCSTLVKATKFIIPTPPHPEAKNGYYVQPEFTENDESRLYSMMKLMEALDQPVVYRVDLYPSKHSESLRSDLPLSIIKSKRDAGGLGRNYELEGIEKSYEKLLEKLDGSPLFSTNIFVFSNNEESGRAILDAAASEAIKKGSRDIAHFGGMFTPMSFLTSERWSNRMTDSTGRFVAVQNKDPFTFPGYYIIDSKAMNFRHSYITTQFTLEEASVFFRFPALEDGEFIQRCKETAPEPIAHGEKNGRVIYLGKDENSQLVYFEMEKLTKHAFISGVPGSGKTVAMCHLVTSLLREDVPFLVLEPAKTEYRAILNNQDFAKRVYLFSPGGNTPFPLRINPFEMPIGITVGHHINRLCQVFEGAFPLEGALPFLLDRAIEAVYREKGWTPKMTRTGKEKLDFPTLSMLYEQIQEELAKARYNSEVAGNLKAAIQMRIGGLLRRELGDMFDIPISTIEPSEWLNISAIVELADLGTSQSNFLTLLLSVLIRESLQARSKFNGDVRHVMFIEEAHNLIGPEANVVTGEHADPKQAATAFISDMLREVRALGEGIVIADQLPSAIAPEVLKNTGLKIALRITSADDRELLGSMMMANAAQLEGMAVSNPGRALVMYEGLQRPFSVQLTKWLSDPSVEGYIADEEEREKAATPLMTPQLREHIKQSLSGDVSDGWYSRVCCLTPWIDMEDVNAKIGDFQSILGSVLDQIDALHRADKAAPKDGRASFAVAKKELGVEIEAIGKIVRRAGFERRQEMHDAIAGLSDRLRSKRENWPPIFEEFGDEDHRARAMYSRYVEGEKNPEDPAWQIARRYFSISDSVMLLEYSFMKWVAEAPDADEVREMYRRYQIIESRLRQDETLYWKDTEWMAFRKPLR